MAEAKANQTGSSSRRRQAASKPGAGKSTTKSRSATVKVPTVPNITDPTQATIEDLLAALVMAPWSAGRPTAAQRNYKRVYDQAREEVRRRLEEGSDLQQCHQGLEADFQGATSRVKEQDVLLSQKDQKLTEQDQKLADQTLDRQVANVRSQTAIRALTEVLALVHTQPRDVTFSALAQNAVTIRFVLGRYTEVAIDPAARTITANCKRLGIDPVTVSIEAGTGKIDRTSKLLLRGQFAYDRSIRLNDESSSNAYLGYAALVGASVFSGLVESPSASPMLREKPRGGTGEMLWPDRAESRSYDMYLREPSGHFMPEGLDGRLPEVPHPRDFGTDQREG